MIKFGTDGWRAVIGEEFTFQNVRIAAQAIAEYALTFAGGHALIVVGYDTRFMSEAFARECATVLAANGVQVLLADTVTPTPLLSFIVKSRQATGGIMVTASHNPFQYNGIKYKASYGGSALPAIISEITERLYRNEPKFTSFDEEVKRGTIVYFNGEKEYFEQLSSLVDLKLIAQAGQRVVTDSMHGAGAGFVKRLLAGWGMEVIEIRSKADCLFGGVNPEPVKNNLQELAYTVLHEKAVAGFALDGDADRIGVVDSTGRFVNAHTVYALLLKYLVRDKKWSGGVVKSFSTSRMIDKLAAKYNLGIFETPIGFKYICELFLSEDILLGGEESGGIGFKNHIPERDGILSTLFLLEMMAAYRKPLNQIIDEMMQDIGCHFYERLDVHCNSINYESVFDRLRNNAPQNFGGENVKEILTLDGIKLVLCDGSWILFRASGTEPMVRIYAEAADEVKVQKLLAEGSERLKLDAPGK